MKYLGLITAVMLCGASVHGAVEVYLLGGQSNMQGLGEVAELPVELQQPMRNVQFWNGEAFETLDPGRTVLGASAKQFGPEVGLACALLVSNTNRQIYLVKYHNGGKPLDRGWDNQKWLGDPPAPRRVNFYPGESASDPNRGTLYAAMLGKFNAALGSLDRSGVAYTIKGFIWMQGEQDAKNAISAGRYAASLARLRARLEQDLGLSHLPIVYGQVLGMPDGRVPTRFAARADIRQSMATADADSGHPHAIPDAHMVSTDGLPYRDDVHFNTAGQLELGRRMAEVLISRMAAAARARPESRQIAR